jgi:hypothetical protein
MGIHESQSSYVSRFCSDRLRNTKKVVVVVFAQDFRMGGESTGGFFKEQSCVEVC